MVARFKTAKAAKAAMIVAAQTWFANGVIVRITTAEHEPKYGGGFSARLAIPGSDLRLVAHNDENWIASYNPEGRHGFEFRATSAAGAIDQLVGCMRGVADTYLKELSHITK